MRPPDDYGWVSNWRIDRIIQGGHCDREGWEYATKVERFAVGGESRGARGEQRWNDRARRRRWKRLCRYKTLLGDAATVVELGRQVQEGLVGMVKGRRMMQEMMEVVGRRRRRSREVKHKMYALIELVRRHGREVEVLLKAVEREQMVGAKKMRNDFAREQRAFEELVGEVERRIKAVDDDDDDCDDDDDDDEGVGPTYQEVEGRTVSAGRSSFRMSMTTTMMRMGGEGMYVSKDAQSEMLMRQMQVGR